MDRRSPITIVTQNVNDAMNDAGVTPATLSQATGIQPSVLRERLTGRSPFTIRELLGVGGFFRIDPAALLIPKS